MQNDGMVEQTFPRKLQVLASILLFTAVFLFASRHSTKGIDLTDEGMYLSTAMRYAMGDIPFKDEKMNIMRPFDVLLSFVFRCRPDITLLQIRHLGLTLHGISLLLFFLLMSRYTPPLLAAILCSTMFFTNNFMGISTPSYNSMSSDFSLISFTLWSYALIAKLPGIRLITAVGGGCAFGIAVISYPPLITLILIPVLFIVLCRFNRMYHEYLLSSIVFFITFLLAIGIFLFTINQFGSWPSFIDDFMSAATITDLANVGLIDKIGVVFKTYMHITASGFLIMMSLFFIFFIIKRKVNSKINRVILTTIVIILYISVFCFNRFLNFLSYHHFPYVILSFSLPLALMAVFMQRKGSSNTPYDGKWDAILYLSLAWSFVQVFTYGFISGNGLKAGIQGLTPLFITPLVTLTRSNALQIVLCNNDLVIQKSTLRKIIPILALALFFGSLKYYSRTVYLGQDIQNLTKPFHHPKLKGIYSTPDSVKIIENLLHYLEKRLKRNDYLLAYNHLPLLYYLTDTRPAYGAAWAVDEWPAVLRKRLVKEMIDNDRIPEYCIRMLTLPYVNLFNIGLYYDEDSPLDNYVITHYYLEKIIYPFEIWRRGPGPRYRLYDNLKTALKKPFFKWQCQDASVETEEAYNFPFLSIYRSNGEFNINCISRGSESIIRVSPANVPLYKGDIPYIQFGSMLKRNELPERFKPDSELVFMMSVRLSSVKNIPNLPGMATTVIFVKNKSDTYDMNAAGVYTTKWHEYIVTKNVGKNADDVQFGISWLPASDHDWLEIKNPRIFTREKELF